jgi:hypothetical protein
VLRKNFRQQKLRYIRNIGSSSDVSPPDGRIGDPAKRSGNLRNALLGIVGRDVMSHRVLAAPLGHDGELCWRVSVCRLGLAMSASRRHQTLLQTLTLSAIGPERLPPDPSSSCHASLGYTTVDVPPDWRSVAACRVRAEARSSRVRAAPRPKRMSWGGGARTAKASLATTLKRRRESCATKSVRLHP